MTEESELSEEKILPFVTPLYEDEALGIVLKSPRLLVHRSEIAPREEQYALQLARDLFGRRVHAVHRLDRGTSGVLVFAFDAATASAMGRAWEAGAVRKRYAAVVRGWLEAPCRVLHALKPVRDPYLKVQKTQSQAAETLLDPWASGTVPVPQGDFPTTRVALLGAEPLTGRRHQIRRHLKHVAHPIVGDATYGKGAVNRSVAAWWRTDRLMLHCARMAFSHPVTGEWLDVVAPPDEEWARMLRAMHWEVAYNAAVAAPWPDRAVKVREVF